MAIAIGVVIFWVVLGLGVFLVAMRGGPRGARQALHTEAKAGQRALWAVVLAAFAFGIVVPALVLNANAANKASAAVGGVHLNGNQQKGRELFSHACNLCHTLQAANAVGRTGPNLDVLIPNIAASEPEKVALVDREAYIESAIREGRARGFGQMPALLYQGKEAEDVASFVAAVAGR
ncbi:MAG TPA: c-type cytochrome [Solirubrobacteraceae bacterium]|nr:c-type cytochrome [Solirubrobacteraceae bacterium]